MSLSHGLGCVLPRVAPHLTRMSFRMHEASAMIVPTAYDQRDGGKVAAVKDQGGVGSCEGHSCSGATETAFALAGHPLGFVPSEDDWYRGLRAIARGRTHAATLGKLTDSGGMTEDAIQFAATFGIKARRVARTSDGRNSDCELTTVNNEEALADLDADAQCVVVGPYAIDPLASDAEQLVKAAIASGIPVRCDNFVDSVFEGWSPGDAPCPPGNMNDQNGGWHAQYIVGYANGLYIVRGSWGADIAENGDWLVSPAWVRESGGLYPWACKKVVS